MITVTISKVETVWEKSREYQRLSDDPKATVQYGYVDAELPKTRTTNILTQSLPDEGLDLAAVIKAINKL